MHDLKFQNVTFIYEEEFQTVETIISEQNSGDCGIMGE